MPRKSTLSPDELEEHKLTWGAIEIWTFGFVLHEMSYVEAFTRSQEALFAAIDMCVILRTVDLRKLVREGHTPSLKRYCQVMEMLLANASLALDKPQFKSAPE